MDSVISDRGARRWAPDPAVPRRGEAVSHRREVTSHRREAAKQARHAASRASPLRLGLHQAGCELRQFVRRREGMIMTLLSPVLLALVFNAVHGQLMASNVFVGQYILTGMMAAGMMTTSFQALAVGIPIERDNGTLKRLAGTPMPPIAYFIGKIVLVLVTTSVQITLLLLVGVVVLNLKLPTDPANWLTFAWVAVLGVSACTLGGIALSSVPRNARSASAVVMPVNLVLQFTSGVFFEFREVPHWLQLVASMFPLKWMAQGMRSVFLPQRFAILDSASTWQHSVTVLVLVAWVVGGLILCLLTFRWLPSDE